MSEQDGTQAVTKHYRSHQTRKQKISQPPALQHPDRDNKQAWKAYWKAQGQTWRSEPEIDEERQKYLDERHSIKPDVKQGIYPFGGIKLSCMIGGLLNEEWNIATLEQRKMAAVNLEDASRWTMLCVAHGLRPYYT